MKIRSRLLVIAVLVTICAWAWTAQGQRQATTSIQWESTPLPTKKKHTLRVTKMSDKRIASQLRLGLHLAIIRLMTWDEVQTFDDATLGLFPPSA